MTRPFFKVCGLTRSEDARVAVASGADAVGLVFVPTSPRRVALDQAIEIVAGLPEHVARVGVVSSLSAAAVRELVSSVGLTAVQAHGEEPPELCRSYGLPVVKAIPTGPDFTLEVLEPYREFPILLDGYTPGTRGGTGRRADWSAARRAREAGFHVLLAGGLTPENLERAVRRVEPVAVDLNSGVEVSPGIKDPERIRDAGRRLDRMGPREEEPWPW